MKISTEKIEGYENMTLEQKLAALEAYEVDEPDYTGYVSKDVFDKTASELSNTKKQLRDKMSADELKAKEDAESREKLQSDYDALLRKVTLSENTTKLLALGYDEALAQSTAEALLDGNLDKLFTNMKKNHEGIEKKIRADVLKETPTPEGGNGSDTITKEKFSKMSIAEQYKYSVDHPEEYKKLYGGN